jgi:hypothetical protein
MSQRSAVAPRAVFGGGVAVFGPEDMLDRCKVKFVDHVATDSADGRAQMPFSCSRNVPRDSILEQSWNLRSSKSHNQEMFSQKKMCGCEGGVTSSCTRMT